MKSLLPLLGLLIALTSFAQDDENNRFPVDPDSKLITYSRVIPVAGATKEQLTGRIKYYFTHAFRERTLRYIESDAPSGLVSTKGVLWLDLGPGNLLAPYEEFLLPVSVWVKDGRYRYVISHIYALEHNSANDVPLETWVKRTASNRFKNRVEEVIQKFIADLNACMQNNKLDDF
ncbi:DUF4468 domain-containing protein [Larkinella bovis]|uniref:DUF4468 domain-containing protein n=1 Tax=Larkinella bovis TaxID=683041 RepID=A0ABW0I5K2_9BACT